MYRKRLPPPIGNRIKVSEHSLFRQQFKHALRRQGADFDRQYDGVRSPLFDPGEAVFRGACGEPTPRFRQHKIERNLRPRRSEQVALRNGQPFPRAGLRVECDREARFTEYDLPLSTRQRHSTGTAAEHRRQ